MTTALYRRYRPQDFTEVIGQEHVTEPLMQALRSGRIGHAYLFSGPRGCGKTTSARILARCLNCEQGPTPTPCGECDSCRALATGGPGSVDVIEIDAASHGGVDDARDLREKAAYGPATSRYKVYIIDEAHMVTPQGFNALLKIVEEPPEHVKFVFATTEPEKVIGTIRSRTHHYPFRLVPPARLLAYLEDLCAREGVAVEPGVLSFVVRAGGGSVRDSLSVLDQLIAGSDEAGLTYAGAAALLGFTEGELLDACVDALAAGDGAGVFRQVERVVETGQDPRRFVEDLLERFRDLIVIAAVGRSADPDTAIHAVLRDLPEDQLVRMRQQAGAFGPGQLSYMADIVNTGLTEMTGATSPRLQLELLCARLLLPAGAGEHGYAARLDRLERRLDVSGGAAAAIPAAGDRGDRPTADDGPRTGPTPGWRERTGRGEPPTRPSAAPAPESADRVHGDPRGQSRGGDDPALGHGPIAHAGPHQVAQDAGSEGAGAVPGGGAARAEHGPAQPAGGHGPDRPTRQGGIESGHAATDRPGPGGPEHARGADGPRGDGRPSADGVGPGRGVNGPAGDDRGQGRPGAGEAQPNPADTYAPGAQAEAHRPDTGRTDVGGRARPDAGTPTERDPRYGEGPGAERRGGSDQARQQGEPYPGAAAHGQAAAEGAPRPAGPRAGVDTEMIRRNWPDVLQRIFGIRRVTWTFLSEHAQVLDYDGSRVLLGLSTAGLATTFRNGPHAEVVRQALSEALGVDARVEGIPASDAPAARAAAPTQRPAPQPAPRQERTPTSGPPRAERAAGPDPSASTGRPPAAGGRPAVEEERPPYGDDDVPPDEESLPPDPRDLRGDRRADDRGDDGPGPRATPHGGTRPQQAPDDARPDPAPRDDHAGPAPDQGDTSQEPAGDPVAAARAHAGARQAREALRAARERGPATPDAAPGARNHDDEASVDDEDIADAGAVGQPVIASVLGGVVIAEEEG